MHSPWGHQNLKSLITTSPRCPFLSAISRPHTASPHTLPSCHLTVKQPPVPSTPAHAQLNNPGRNGVSYSKRGGITVKGPRGLLAKEHFPICPPNAFALPDDTWPPSFLSSDLSRLCPGFILVIDLGCITMKTEVAKETSRTPYSKCC